MSKISHRIKQGKLKSCSLSFAGIREPPLNAFKVFLYEEVSYLVKRSCGPQTQDKRLFQLLVRDTLNSIDTEELGRLNILLLIIDKNDLISWYFEAFKKEFKRMGMGFRDARLTGEKYGMKGFIKPQPSDILRHSFRHIAEDSYLESFAL